MSLHTGSNMLEVVTNPSWGGPLEDKAAHAPRPQTQTLRRAGAGALGAGVARGGQIKLLMVRDAIGLDDSYSTFSLVQGLAHQRPAGGVGRRRPRAAA